MTRRLRHAVAMLIVSAAVLPIAASAAPPQLRIGRQIILPADIADARAYPVGIEDTAMLVTLEPAALKRIGAESAPIELRLDGRSLCGAETPLLGGDGALLLPCFKGRRAEEIAAMAKQLSGKDPLPDSLDDEP